MSVYASQIGLLWSTVESYGIDPGRVIPADVYRPGKGPLTGERVSSALFDEIIAGAVALVSDPAAGLRSAKALHPTHLGALGHAWMACPSLRVAIQTAQRYHRMLNERVAIRIDQTPDLMIVEYVLADTMALQDERADSLLAGLLTLCRLNAGAELKPAFVHMRRAAPADVGPWNRCFGVEVDFGRDRNCLAILNRDADKPLTGYNRTLLAIHEDILQRHLAELDRKDIVNRARVAIMDHLPSGEVSEEKIADELSMTQRTLYNNLASRGVTFRSLLTDIRKDLVRRYLIDSSYSVTEIAFLVGYADSSAFSRAFRSWFGTSPTEFREAPAP